jgi:predicted RecB family endonuclease
VATAEKTTVERVVTEEGFTLKLTVDEAETLVAVLSQVGGSPSRSPRGVAERVLETLVEAGARTYYPRPVGHPVNLARGSVRFDDYPAEA